MAGAEFEAEMEFGSDQQKLRFSDNRTKLDGFDAESPQDMKHMDRKHSQTDSKYNVRMSMAWDRAFFTSPGVLEPEELFRSVGSRIGVDEVDVFEEEMLLPVETSEPRVMKCNKARMCDLRKSLAWNDAFFTNAGVLDPEELSIVNRGFRNQETRLAGIDDVSKSTESSLSIESGASSLQSLEVDLFEASKKLDAFSQSRMKGMISSKRQNKISNDAVRSAKKDSLSTPSQKQLVAAPNSSGTQQKSAYRSRNVLVDSVKKTSFGASSAKVGTTTKAASDSRLTNPRKINLENSKSSSHYSSRSSKSLSFPVVGRKPVSCLLNHSNSAFKAPSRYSTRNESEPQDSCHSSQEFSASKSYYFTSPDSSTDRWTSESSSTSAAKRSRDPKAFQGTTCRQVHFESSAGSRESSSSRISRNAKLSSLQAPSPKAVYFDEENSSAAIRNGLSQFHPGKKRVEIGSGSKPRIAPTLARTTSKHQSSALQIVHNKNPSQVTESLDVSSTRATVKIFFSKPCKVENEDSSEAEKPNPEYHVSSIDDIEECKETTDFPGKNLILDERNKENIHCFKERVDDGELVIEVRVNKPSSDAQSTVLMLKL